jgi:hypothetical protein
MFKKRLGPHPHDAGQTPGLTGCPDIWELENGDIAVIGIDQTNLLVPSLPNDANCGPDEKIVVIPRRILVGAKPYIS